MPDDERDQARQVAFRAAMYGKDSSQEIEDLIVNALADAGLLRSGGDTGDEVNWHKYFGEKVIEDLRTEVAKLRAERDEALADLNFTTVSHNATERAIRAEADRDRAVAETAALRDAVRALADGSDGLGFVNVHELRALLAETDPDAVRELHANYCDECATDGPCPTIRALDGDR